MLMLSYLMSILYLVFLLFVFFFFKQKTAYEMRISDWSSDVCSSDLSITLTSDQVSQTVNAALENPLLGSQARASLLNSYAQYYRIVLKRPQEAVSLMLAAEAADPANVQIQLNLRSEEHTSELQSLMSIPYAEF